MRTEQHEQCHILDKDSFRSSHCKMILNAEMCSQ